MNTKSFLIGLCLWCTSALFSSDSESSAHQRQIRFMFSSNETDYDLFLQERVSVGSPEYFANRERVLNSIKGKEATPERILTVYKAVDLFRYSYVQQAKQQEGLTPEQVDQKIVELSLSEEHRAGIIHKVKSE